MGQVTIPIDELGSGSVVLDNAPTTDIEHVRVVRSEGEQPLVELGVENLDGNSVRINVVDPDGGPEVVVAWDGAPDAHERAAEAQEAPTPDPDEEAEDGAESTAEVPADLHDLSRQALDAYAADVWGVENPEKLPNKDAVIEQIDAAKED